MNEENKIANMAKLIADLSEENERLKEENMALHLTVDMSGKQYDESTGRAKTLIAQCDQRIAEYNEAIAGANKAKKEYEDALKELRVIKKEYEIKMHDFMRQLKLEK